MIRIAEEKDKNLILNILRKNIIDNIYLYIDIFVFGLDKEYMRVWVNEEQKNINQIILKYYDSFQIYSKNNSFEAIIDLILDHKPSMISGSENVIREIHEELSSYYNASYGVVLEQEKIKMCENNNVPTLAILEDMEEIAELICIDKGIGGHYTAEILKEQLSSRFQEKMGRNYIIKIEDKIVAHYGTYAEISDVAVMGGLIVHPSYRGQGYAKILHTYLSNILIDEEKRVFLFCQEDVLKMYLSLGSKIRGRYGKLTINNEREI